MNDRKFWQIIDRAAYRKRYKKNAIRSYVDKPLGRFYIATDGPIVFVPGSVSYDDYYLSLRLVAACQGLSSTRQTAGRRVFATQKD